MGKQKTNKSVAKRFKLSRNGKVRFKRAGKQKLQSGKSPSRRRKLRKWARPDNPKLEKKLASMLHG